MDGNKKDLYGKQTRTLDRVLERRLVDVLLAAEAVADGAKLAAPSGRTSDLYCVPVADLDTLREALAAWKAQV